MPHDLTDDQWRQDRQRIGRAIRDARLGRNLTQEAVFLAIPMNRSYYQEIEAGDANPTLDTLLSIATAIGVPLAHLVCQAAAPAGGDGGDRGPATGVGE